MRYCFPDVSDFFPPFAGGDKIIQIGEGGGKKIHFCCLNFAALAPATPPSSAGKTNHKHLCKFAFFHAWDCRVVTGWRVKVRSGLREARWIKGDCQLCCTRQMSGMPAMFFLPQTPFLTNLHSLPVSFHHHSGSCQLVPVHTNHLTVRKALVMHP